MNCVILYASEAVREFILVCSRFSSVSSFVHHRLVNGEGLVAGTSWSSTSCSVTTRVFTTDSSSPFVQIL